MAAKTAVGFAAGQASTVGVADTLAIGAATATAPAAGDNSASVPTTGFLASYTLRADLVQTWTPAFQAQALANLGAASAGSVTALASRSISRGRILALAIAN